MPRPAAALSAGVRAETLDNGPRVSLKRLTGFPTVTATVAGRVGPFGEP